MVRDNWIKWILLKQCIVQRISRNNDISANINVSKGFQTQQYLFVYFFFFFFRVTISFLFLFCFQGQNSTFAVTKAFVKIIFKGGRETNCGLWDIQTAILCYISTKWTENKVFPFPKRKLLRKCVTAHQRIWSRVDLFITLIWKQIKFFFEFFIHLLTSGCIKCNLVWVIHILYFIKMNLVALLTCDNPFLL